MDEPRLTGKAFGKALAAYAEENPEREPVVAPFAKKLVGSYWARQWCLALNGYQDLGYGLAAGRSLLRKQAVFDITITTAAEGATVAATVWDGQPFAVTAQFSPLAPSDLQPVAAALMAESPSLAALLAGDIPDDLAEVLADPERGIMPDFSELRLGCTCPDYTELCAHAGALLYAIAVRLDEQPHLLFALRGISAAELLDAGWQGSPDDTEPPEAAQAADTEDDIAEMFDLDWDTSAPGAAFSGKE